MQLIFSVFLAFSAVSTGLPQQGNSPQTTPPATPTSSSTSPASSILNEAIARLKKPSGTVVRFRMESKNPSTTIISAGRSVRGEGNKVRVELTVTQSGRSMTRKLICDGITVDQITNIGNETTRERYTLEEMEKALNDLGKSETANMVKEDMQAELEGRLGREGTSAILSDLQKRMTFTDPKPMVIEISGRAPVSSQFITGTWNKEYLDQIAPPKKGDSQKEDDRQYLWKERIGYLYFARTAILHVDEKTRVPLRLEMIGPIEKQGPDERLIRVDWLEVKDLTPDELQTVFNLTPEEKKIEIKEINLSKRLQEQHRVIMEMMERQRQAEKAKPVDGK